MDNKTMVQGSKEVGRDVPAARNNDTPAVPGDYHDFGGSQTKGTANPYDSRMSALSDALGNKDSVKG